MLSLVVGDPHFKPSSQQLVKLFLPWLHGVVEEYKPQITVNLGDTFHTHNVIRSEIMAMVTDHVRVMQQMTDYWILVGNHDMAHHKTPEIHAWLPFKDGYDIHVVDELETYMDMAFLPYVDSPEEFRTLFNKAVERGCHTIFCHQTFLGANWGFVKAKDGVVVPSDYTGQIISGHIHKQQDLGCVWYPGTPYAHEASDHNEVKGIFLYDTETKERTFLKSPLPQWVTVRATPSDFQERVAEMDKINKNHLVIEGPGPEVNAAVDSKAFKDLRKEYGFSVKKNSTSSVKSDKSIKKVATVEDAVVEFVDKIYDGAVDKSKLKSKCIQALQ